MARQFALLERLGAATIVLVEALGVEAAKYPGSSGAAAFVQVGRALRQTVALEMRLDGMREAREQRGAGDAPQRATVADAASPDDLSDDAPGDAADGAPGNASGEAADVAADDGGDRAKPQGAAATDGAAAAGTREGLLRDLRERPDPAEAADELHGRPTGEVAGRICRMLRIEADLTCFTDQEMGRLAPLNHPMPPPPPAPLSDAEFEAALARPSQMPLGQRAAAISPNARLLAIEAAAADAVCARSGRDPPG